MCYTFPFRWLQSRKLMCEQSSEQRRDTIAVMITTNTENSAEIRPN